MIKAKGFSPSVVGEMAYPYALLIEDYGAPEAHKYSSQESLRLAQIASVGPAGDTDVAQTLRPA